MSASRLSALVVSESMNSGVKKNQFARKQTLTILDGKYFDEIDNGSDIDNIVSGLCV